MSLTLGYNVNRNSVILRIENHDILRYADMHDMLRLPVLVYKHII